MLLAEHENRGDACPEDGVIEETRRDDETEQGVIEEARRRRHAGRWGASLRAQHRTRTDDPFLTMGARERTSAGGLRVSAGRAGVLGSSYGWLWVGSGRLRLP
jgi:hypothetical protein